MKFIKNFMFFLSAVPWTLISIRFGGLYFVLFTFVFQMLCFFCWLYLEKIKK